MDILFRCQSCGLPLGDGFFGTNEDNTDNHKYCKFCFLDGAFTDPYQTMEEMIQRSVENMVHEIGIPEEQALALANEYIPRLKRWQAH